MNEKSYNPYFPQDVQRRYQQLRAAYGEQDSDIYISSYTRSGTTWTQMILYQLTTNGNMDFDHIFDVSPWLYYSALLEKEPTCPPPPRLLKTHDDYSFFSQQTKGRFVFVCRNGKDVLVSFYHHKINAKGYQGSFQEHFDEFMQNKYYNWFEHVKAWVENKNNFPILYVKYESLKNDFDKTIERIADFCDIPLNTSILERTRERTSFEFMKKHAVQLGPKPEHFRHPETGQYRVKNQAEFIRRGNVGEGEAVLTDQQKKEYYKKFNEVLGHLEFLSEYGE
ncbi:MAG: sulfotransferase domain-containing protein [Candidatus Electrothrix sp. EH2]|nr:sulfotransferase domain-containing protein [Candidatus Electrothrix sp. EH2]